MDKVTQKELKEWLIYVRQYNNGYHLSSSDRSELLHLNHRIMSLCHDIHNASMVGDLKVVESNSITAFDYMEDKRVTDGFERQEKEERWSR